MTTLPTQFILFCQQSSHALAFVNRFNIILAIFVAPLSLQPQAVSFNRLPSSLITRSTIEDVRGEINPLLSHLLIYPNIPYFARRIQVAAVLYPQLSNHHKIWDINNQFAQRKSIFRLTSRHFHSNFIVYLVLPFIFLFGY